MNSVQKVAAFLCIIGLEKGKKVMAMMDSVEIKNILAELGKIAELTPTDQECVRNEFVQMGYEPGMNPAETLYVLRQLFNGSKITNKERTVFRKR